jgi:adenylate kinase
MPTPVALTGTPGTGKSAVGRRLARGLRVVEVSALAREVGAARSRGRSLEVDLPRLVRSLVRRRALDGIDVVVGHLAHWLPVEETIVLRCHPVELLRRLRRARRGSAADRQANFVSETTDVILVEALATGRPVFEIDTTGRSIASVAREVRQRIRSDGPARAGAVDWLSDPEVTEHLLDRPR